MTSISSHEKFLEKALKLAQKAKEIGEVPVGALVVQEGKIIASAFNQKELKQNIFAHAEILALEKAQKKLKRWRLTDCILYSTLEPCFMCAGALVHARISQVIYSLEDPKFGGISSLFTFGQDERLNHRFCHTSGIKEAESKRLLQEFFRDLRTKKTFKNKEFKEV